MGDISIKGRSPLLKGGRVGLKQGGAFGPLRGTTAGGVAKAFRGRAGFKESQALQSKILKVPKTHVTETRTISGIEMPVKYTKPRWKSWKKTKKRQYKRIEASKAKE